MAFGIGRMHEKVEAVLDRFFCHVVCVPESHTQTLTRVHLHNQVTFWNMTGKMPWHIADLIPPVAHSLLCPGNFLFFKAPFQWVMDVN